jgi:hypothetical protein
LRQRPAFLHPDLIHPNPKEDSAMNFTFICLAFAAGYAASVCSWLALRTWLTGAETEISALEDKIKALKARL